MVVSGMFGLFAGGWLASYLAGVTRDEDGTLHGLVTCRPTLSHASGLEPRASALSVFAVRGASRMLGYARVI